MVPGPDDPDGVVASAVARVDVAEAEQLLAEDETVWSPAELAYARARSDPARRLAARLAAKRAACRALGKGVVRRTSRWCAASTGRRRCGSRPSRGRASTLSAPRTLS